MTAKEYYFFWKKLIILFSITCLVFGTSEPYSTKAQDQEDKCTKISLAYGKYLGELNALEESFVECGGSRLKEFFVPRQVDKFGVINLEDEWARLDAFAIALRNEPELLAYVVIYGGKRNKYGELKERPKPLVHYLINDRKIEPERIRIIEGGFREKFEFELWTSYSDKMFPPLSPIISPEKVIFRGKMKPLPLDMY